MQEAHALIEHEEAGTLVIKNLKLKIANRPKMSIVLPGIELPTGYFIDHNTEHTQWDDPRLNHPEIWTTPRQQQLKTIVGQFDSSAVPLTEIAVKTMMVRQSMDTSATINALQQAGYRRKEQRRRSSATRPSPSSVRPTIVEAVDDGADQFSVLAIRARFPTAKDALVKDLLVDLNNDVHKCIESLKGMGYADREAAQQEAEQKRKAKLEADKRKAIEEREKRIATEKSVSAISSRHPFASIVEIQEKLNWYTEEAVDKALFVQELRESLSTLESEVVSDAEILSTLKKCKNDVDATVHVLRRAHEIVRENNAAGKSKKKSAKTSPVKVNTNVVPKKKTVYVSPNYTPSAVGHDERVYCGPNLDLHRGADQALHCGPQ